MPSASDPPVGPTLPVQPGQLPVGLPPEVPSPTEPDEVFDRYARLVRSTLGVPVGLISLVSTGGQVFPGAEGLPEPWQQTRRTGLSHSFCQYVVAHDTPLVVRDAREDPVLEDNLAICDIGVVAYAGFPIHDPDGVAVGSLCAIDTQPREWTQRELDVLSDLAATAARELTLRRTTVQALTSREEARSAAEHVTQISESMAIGYLALDADWRITYVNPEGRRALGAVGGDLTGQVLWEVFPATVGTEFEANYRRALVTGQEVSFDAYYPAPLDTWFEIRAVPTTAGPHTGGLALYFLDISARRHAQAAADRVGAQLSALGQVALALADADEIGDLVATMAEEGLTALGADGGSVAVPDPEDPEQLLSYITANFGEDTRAEFGRLPLRAQLPVTVAARTGRRVLLSDQEACAELSPLVLEANAATGCQAWASIPLRAGGQVLGVLTAGWRREQEFPEEQLTVLETFAAQCAQALQRLRAREAERAAAEAARLSARRQSALVAIAQSLAAAQDQDAVLDVLSQQGTALLGANGCGLCLREDDGAHVVTVTSDSYAQVRTTVQRVPADFPLPAIRSAATGVSFFLTDRREAEASFPGSDAVYVGVGVQASAAVPMWARDRLLGCLSIGFSAARPWTPDERDLLTAFAALTAQALERIAAGEAERAALTAAAGTSETLQRAMLTSPPELADLELAVRYAAAADHAEVGGDWYDVFVSGRGTTSLVVGDVTGHDMRAASVMGQLRNLLRGIGFTSEGSPAQMLSALDRATAGLGLEAISTAVVAQFSANPTDPTAGVLRWSNAGHPPPLLIHHDGTTEFLDSRSDLLLGIEPDLPRHDHEVRLPAGTTVLLYTDGLVERRGATWRAGTEWLADTARDLAGASLDQLCDELLRLVEGHLDDDVALLALRARSEAG